MQIALVISSTRSTIKDESIRGRKADTAGKMAGQPFVAAIDLLELGGEVTYRKM